VMSAVLSLAAAALVFLYVRRMRDTPGHEAGEAARA